METSKYVELKISKCHSELMGTRSFERAIVPCVIHTFLKFIARSKGTYIILYLLLALLIRLLFLINYDCGFT